MNNIEITLTSVDKAILNSYAAMVPGLSAYLGAHYEIVLHSLASLSNSVIAICNGHHTGRAVGSPITDLALQMLSEIRADRSYVTTKNYFTTKKDGTHLKSTTIPIRGEHQRIIGLLCMNLYLDTPFFDILANLMPDVPLPPVPAVPVPTENFATSSQSLIADMVERVSAEVHRDKSIPTACKNKVIVERLYAQGIFSFKESIVRVAELIDPTPANILEVLTVAITRHVVLSHDDPWSNVACIACIAGLFAIRRFLIRRSELKEEMVEDQV